jgi:ABC-2 type transport system permease protein
MHFLFVSLRKDWARALRDPSQFAIALGIPVVLAVLMSMVFGREPAAPQGRLLVADEDHSIASVRFLDGFRREPLNKMITIEQVTRDAGRARIDRGDASAFLLIPRGMQQAFLMNLPCRLELVTNPAQGILPQIIQQTLGIAVDAGTFFLSEAKPLIELENVAVRHTTPSPARSFAAVFLPSSLFMGLLFLANAAAGDIWKERTAGTLRRLASSPVSMDAYLMARVIFVVLLYLAAAFGGLAAAQWLAGLPVANLPAAALWMAFAGTVFYLFFLWIAVQAETQRAASVLANLIIFPLAMLGGCFFPFEWMPKWMVVAGKLTPNGWALTQFKSILDGAVDSTHLGTAVTLLAAFSALAFILTVRRLRSVFAV